MYPVSCALLSALAVLACGVETGRSPSQGLVFARYAGTSTDLVQVRLADGAERVLTPTPERHERWPYWSSQAQRLLFQAGPADGPNDLFLWDPATGEERPLVQTPERDERWQRWSPDGTRVVYAFHGGDPPAGVAVVDPATGETRIWASSGPDDFFLRPSFAPDGQRLVAQRRGRGGSGSSLWLLRPDAPPQPLTDDPVRFFMKGRFSRDGSRIFYSRRHRGPHPHQIFRMDADGGNPQMLVGGPGVNAHSAAPAPVGNEVAFVSERDDAYDLFVADFETGRMEALTRTPERSELAPRWSPDGKLLVVTTLPARAGLPHMNDEESLEETGIAVIDRDGRERFHTRGFMPDWMPPWP